MGVVYIKRPSENSILGLWRITESVEELLNDLDLSGPASEIYKAKRTEARKKEWLAVRALLQNMLNRPDEINYDIHGRPSLASDAYGISLSHSAGYVSVYLDKTRSTGVDIQKLKKTLKAGANFFLNEKELDWIDTESNEVMHIAWSAKETIYKYANHPDLDIKKDVTLNRFEGNQKGTIEVTISKNDVTGQARVNYEVFEQYVLTITIEHDL